MHRVLCLFCLSAFLSFGFLACSGEADVDMDGDSDRDVDADRESEIDDESDFASDTPVSFTLLHSNDVHAHIEGFDSYYGECDEDESAGGNCFGGVARHATYIANVRAEEDHVLLVDAGDRFQGTLFYNLFKGEEAYTFMNRQRYDAMVPGNHEFDDGPQVLADFIDQLDFPMVATNIDAGDSALKQKLQPTLIREIDGVHVGILGLTTESTASLSSPSDAIVFQDVVVSAQAAIDSLEDQGVRVIIALTHLGLDRDEELATQLSGIDIIIGGHSHSLLSNDPELDRAGPYPLVTESASGEPVLIGMAGQYGEYMGRLDVVFDAQGVLIPEQWSGETVWMNSGIAEDAETRALVETMAQALASFENTIVGQSAVELVGDRDVCRFHECNLGDLIAEAMLWQTAGDDVELAFINSGNIRAGIDIGDISLAEIYTTLPFGNSISTFEVNGQTLLDAIEYGVSVATDPDSDGTGRFLQVAGMRLLWDPAMETGARVVSVEIGNYESGFVELDLDASYRVATNGYIRQGGDGYEMLADGAVAPYDFGMLLSEAVTRYITAHSPITQEIDGRISRAE